jgi:hypothetical protein
MNGIDHYKRAEDLMAQATATRPNAAGIEVCYVTTEEQERLTRQANVHALLALSAAQADATAFQLALYELNGQEPPTRAARKRITADKSREAANDYL